jgi:predicted nucleic acid-binding protein
MISVTDSGPMIALAKLNRLRLLPAMYDTVVIPHAVYDEVVTIGLRRGYPDAAIADAFLRRMNWHPITVVDMLPELTSDVRLGRGEREALTLAKTYNALVLMDEDYARTIADQLGLAHIGTLGILTEAFRRGLLSADALDELLASIESRDDIWIHPELCGRVRREVLGR